MGAQSVCCDTLEIAMDGIVMEEVYNHTNFLETDNNLHY